MTAQCDQQLRPLAFESLMSSEQHGLRLLIRALGRNKLHIWLAHSHRDRSRVIGVILAAFDKWLHIDRRDQPDFMAVALRFTAQ